MDEITIYLKKGRMIAFGILCIPFILLGLLFTFLGFTDDEPVIISLFGALFALFFGFCLFLFIKKVVKPKPVIILTEEGIQDQASSAGFGMIKWEEIEAVKLIRFSGQKLLGIYTYDKNLIINRSHGFKRLLNNMNRGMIDAQATIAIKNLDYKVDDLFDEINLRMNSGAEDQFVEEAFEE